MGSLKIFFAIREMFTDVPNPAIYYFDLFFWSWLNCGINQELRKHLFYFVTLTYPEVLKPFPVSTQGIVKER